MDQSPSLVKISYVDGFNFPPVIGYEFVDFSVIFVYDQLRACGGFEVFFGKDRYKYPGWFTSRSDHYSKQRVHFEFNIPCHVVEKVKSTFSHLNVAQPGKIDIKLFKKLFTLLESFTPRDILPKFFKNR